MFTDESEIKYLVTKEFLSLPNKTLKRCFYVVVFI